MKRFCAQSESRKKQTNKQTKKKKGKMLVCVLEKTMSGTEKRMEKAVKYLLLCTLFGLNRKCNETGPGFFTYFFRIRIF